MNSFENLLEELEVPFTVVDLLSDEVLSSILPGEINRKAGHRFLPPRNVSSHHIECAIKLIELLKQREKKHKILAIVAEDNTDLRPLFEAVGAMHIISELEIDDLPVKTAVYATSSLLLLNLMMENTRTFNVYCVGPLMSSAAIENVLNLDLLQESTVVALRVNCVGEKNHPNGIKAYSPSTTPVIALQVSAALNKYYKGSKQNLLASLACVLSLEKQSCVQYRGVSKLRHCTGPDCSSFRCCIAEAALCLLGLQIQGVLKFSILPVQLRKDAHFLRFDRIYKDSLQINHWLTE